MFSTMVFPHLDYLQCHPRIHIANMVSNLKWLSIKQRIMFLSAVKNYAFQNSKLHVSLVGPCFTSVRYKEIHLRGPFLYPDHSRICSLPKALDSGISYQHPFELPQTSGYPKKPQLSSLHIISTSTNQHYISHIHKQLHNKSAWLHIPSHHLT